MTRYQRWRPKMPGSTSLRRLKLVGFIYIPVRRLKDVSNRSDKLTYQLRRYNDVSAWSRTFILVTKMGQFLLRTILVNLLGVSSGSVSLRYRLVRCYNVSKTSVSFRYQLWRLCDVLSWSVSLRYQLLRRYDVSNRSVSFTYQLRRRDDVLAWSATSRPICIVPTVLENPGMSWNLNFVLEYPGKSLICNLVFAFPIFYCCKL